MNLSWRARRLLRRPGTHQLTIVVSPDGRQRVYIDGRLTR